MSRLRVKDKHSLITCPNSGVHPGGLIKGWWQKFKSEPMIIFKDLQSLLSFFIPFIFFGAGCVLLFMAYRDHQNTIPFCILGLVFIITSQLSKYEKFQFLSLKITKLKEIEEDVEKIIGEIKKLVTIQAYINVDCMSNLGAVSYFTMEQQLNSLRKLLPPLENMDVHPDDIMNIKEIVYKKIARKKLIESIISYIYEKNNFNKASNKTNEEKKIFEGTCYKDYEVLN